MDSSASPSKLSLKKLNKKKKKLMKEVLITFNINNA